MSFNLPALTAILGVLIVVGLLWTRQALVSLNKDIRTMLDRQTEIRQRLDALEAQQRAEAAYIDPSFPERACDRCGKTYQGPAVYCSLACAIADA